MVKLYEGYESLGTLDAVARTVGLTRERVRQLLVKGTKLGLFRYVKKSRRVVLTRADLLASYERLGTINGVARENKISPGRVMQLMRESDLAESDLRDLRRTRRMGKCVSEYNAIVDTLGHHPTTTEIQANPRWRPLSTRITRLWGSTAEFRKARSVPGEFPAGNPRFREDVRPALERHRRLAMVVRASRLDAILDHLSSGVPRRLAEIAADLRLSTGTVWSLIRTLIAAGRVVREGSGNQVSYCAIEGDDR
jgi:hypothetical protein